MPTLYCDLENGNDDFAGTSFAVLAQGTNGRITSTTFSSATASFPNDGSLINQYLSIFNGTIYAVYQITAWVSATSLTIAAISGGTGVANQAVDRQYYIGGRWRSLTNGATAVRTIPGDTVRIMGSPAPTSLGQTAVWTSQALQATKTITGATNATPISITCTAHGYSTGDTVVITGVNGNTNANGTWEITSTGANTFTLDGSAGNAAYTSGGTARLRNNTRVMLTTAVTQNIASTGPGRAAWVASANASATLDALTKEHVFADRIETVDAFTTGLVAYFATGSLNLSDYQQVSFWVRITSGTLAASTLSLRLCSDAAGTTTVNTVSIPALPISGRWMPVTVDLGLFLGSNINSIALYQDVDRTNIGLLFSNIIACKASSAADSLTLTSLIGKNTTGETFWGIQSINGRRVMLDADTNAQPTSTSVCGYYGTSATVTTWKRETIKLGPAALSTTVLQTINESGTDGSPITYSGGWDRTNMSTQTLETWLDGVNGNGYGLDPSARSFVDINNVAFTRMFSAIGNAGIGSYNNISIVAANCCTLSTSAAAITMAAFSTVTVGHIVANGSSSLIRYAGVPPATLIITGLVAYGAQRPVELRGGARLIGATGNQGLVYVGDSTPDQFRIDGPLTPDFIVKDLLVQFGISATAGGPMSFKNVLLSPTVGTEITTLNPGAILYSHDHDQTTGNHKIFGDGYLISAATDQRKTPSGISWKIQPNSTISRHSRSPVILSLAKVACSANNLVTVKAWMYRDNSGLTMRLVCKGGQIAGVPNDVTSAITTTNAWEEETITFTPTEAGVVEITAEAWGGTTFSGWVDDMTITQA